MEEGDLWFYEHCFCLITLPLYKLYIYVVSINTNVAPIEFMWFIWIIYFRRVGIGIYHLNFVSHMPKNNIHFLYTYLQRI